MKFTLPSGRVIEGTVDGPSVKPGHVIVRTRRGAVYVVLASARVPEPPEGV